MNEFRFKQIDGFKIKVWKKGKLDESKWDKSKPLTLILVTSNEVFKQMLVWNIWKNQGSFVKYLYADQDKDDLNEFKNLFKNDQVLIVEGNLEDTLIDMGCLVDDNDDEYHVTFRETEQEEPIKKKIEVQIHESQWVRARDYA